MPETAAMEEVYSAIEESARLLDVACSREEVWPVLATYGDGLDDGMVVLSMAGGDLHRGELDYNFTVPPESADPYSTAVAQGFVEGTDHPVGALLADIRARCALQFYGVECGLAGGFKKTYAFFPLDRLQSPATLAAVPSMPPAVGEWADTFARHGLTDHISIVGIDYRRRTMNLYFGRFPAERVEPDNVRSLLGDLGVPVPDESMLEFVRKSFSIYPTFSWDSPKIERVCFSVVTPDATALPARLEPEIGRFTAAAPYSYAGDRMLVYGATVSPTGQYYKAGVYYRRPPQFWNNMQLFDKVVDQA